ncbi:MAG: ABC transporter ATP-binding protein [Patescibacteria group bacterium]
MSINKDNRPQQNVFTLVKTYIPLIIFLIIFTISSNGLNLFIPNIISSAIDSDNNANFNVLNIVIKFSFVSAGIFILGYIQSIFQTYISEKVAKDLRSKIINKISKKEYSYIQDVTSSKLLTNLTADVDSVKVFISQAVSSMISSIFLIFGVSIILFSINWKLALVIAAIVPISQLIFFVVFGKIKKLFTKAQETIDWLNKVINESILGASIVRLLNSQQQEYLKFLEANTKSKDVGLSIVKLFASLIPIMSFMVNVTMLIIIVFGGHSVIIGHMTLGDFSAFNNYLLILIFPVVMLGFVGNMIAQAGASYSRICEILDSEEFSQWGSSEFNFSKNIELNNINLKIGKDVLKNISFNINKGSKTAIIGPTAAGKTQLFYLLSGLIKPTDGVIKYDNLSLFDYDKTSFYKQVGFVFQDSVMFNLTLRENIVFSSNASDEFLNKAIETSELQDFINTLDNGLDTIITERGSNLSGGQKQRIMLARALTLNPKILFLDDFTARVDNKTEQKILNNLKNNYPEITLISITQKIAPIKDYDNIILLMEGELLITGKHQELLERSPEYSQIYNSQNSINNYELHS